MSTTKSKTELNKDDLKLLNSNKGLRMLFKHETLDIVDILKELKESNRLEELRIELVKIQEWVLKNNKKVIVIFEGRDAAGKGGAINGMTAFINPRHYKTVALSKPSEDQKGEWYFKRYVEKLPRPGEMVFFDRSWYNRAVVEPVNNFCTQKEYEIFMGQVNDFERMLKESDNYLIKFFLNVSKEEQHRRLSDMKSNPLKKWRMTPVDSKAQKLWDKYSEYEKRMFDLTNTKIAPWFFIDGNSRNGAIITALEQLILSIPYKD